MPQARFLLACSLICLLASAGACAQGARQAARQPYDNSNSAAGLQVFHLDQRCRILPDPAHLAPGKKPRPYTDSAICHLESVLSSSHWEEKITTHQLQRTLVFIREHEFVLQNMSDTRALFVVQQEVPSKWSVDSDPQPVQIVGRIAYFHVYAEPGQIVRLHVGMRREYPMKPKPI